MNKIPYIGFGNETLEKQAPMKKGDMIDCPRCGGKHPVKCGTNDEGEESNILMFYSCGGKIYLAGVEGKRIIGIKSDCAGDIGI